MDRVKDASEGGIKAATVPGVRALLRAHIPKHSAETLGEAAISPDSTLGIGAVPALGPIAGSLVKTCCKRSGPTEISPVNVSVDLVPQPFTNSLVAHSDYFDRPQNVRFQER